MARHPVVHHHASSSSSTVGATSSVQMNTNSSTSSNNNSTSLFFLSSNNSSNATNVQSVSNSTQSRRNSGSAAGSGSDLGDEISFSTLILSSSGSAQNPNVSHPVPSSLATGANHHLDLPLPHGSGVGETEIRETSNLPFSQINCMGTSGHGNASGGGTSSHLGISQNIGTNSGSMSLFPSLGGSSNDNSLSQIPTPSAATVLLTDDRTGSARNEGGEGGRLLIRTLYGSSPSSVSFSGNQPTSSSSSTRGNGGAGMLGGSSTHSTTGLSTGEGGGGNDCVVSSKSNFLNPPASSVHELLECPVCTNTMFPPIHQCPNGHTLCSLCKTRVHNRCPTCRYELGNIRCLALEKVAESLELPCKHSANGCGEILPYYSKLKHEANCSFRPYNCPYAGSECGVTGDIPFLVSHLRDEHKVDMHNGSTFNHRYVKQNPHEVENATWMLTVFNCFGQHFCLHFEAFQLGTAPVYMAFLRFMGDESDAKRYAYSLEVGNYGRKMTWQGLPRSIRDSHRKVRDSYDGLIIQRSMALFFSGGERKELKLRVTGKIWKED